MKLKDLKPGQKFKFVANELVTSTFLKLEEHAVNLSTSRYVRTDTMQEDEVQLADKREAVYHAARQAFVCGQERVPWFMVVHALREGLNMEEYKTYNLTEDNYKDYSQLRELVSWLKQSL